MSESMTSLNNDVLLSIISVSTLPVRTVISIMTTCRFLYHEGAKLVLQHPVSLSGSEQKALSLLSFIKAEDFSRCSYVRTLHILTDPIPESVAKMLVDIVPRMSSLIRLSLRVEQSLEAYPNLLPAFASLQSVKKLTVVDTRARSCELVKMLQSELVSATIAFSPAARFDEPQLFVASSHPLYLLQRSASTLQELMCRFWCDSYMDSQTVLSLSEPVYPNVRNLVLYNIVAPSANSYIGAFSNLMHLQVESTRTIIEESAHLGISNTQRRLNLMIHALADEDQLANDEEPFAWQSIQTYTGPLSDLWTLGIPFPIPRLTLTDVPRTRFSLALTEVLAAARPVHLAIAFENQPFCGVIDSEFLDALRSDGASGLRSLGLVADLMAGDVDGSLDVDRILTRIESVLSGLHLDDLQLVMRDITPPETEPAGEQTPIPAGGAQGGLAREAAPRDPTEGTPSLPPHDGTAASDRASFTLAERTLEDVDVHAFVRRLSTAIPTLRTAAISLGRPRRCGGGLRTTYLGERERDDTSSSSFFTQGNANSALGEELKGLGVAAAEPYYFNASWASLSRSWYRGLRAEQ